ncbi:hypothetical protein PISMIDRAFT_109352 [Pisolithus microcarpus 441]|uniref:DDE Tnp4 domain-containing protein n=1 Tax=Pisolithus microcarpus 441 TaxID=765257 RepID=A0A0C9ZEX2_9AGAM|nr:hypothetical protein PISMIDRAFT_109352 [Pisolithus microcarpus 441]
MTELISTPYTQLLDTIKALHDEVEATCILKCLASQLPLLDHFADHRPSLFWKKLCVNPAIFDKILDQISSHPVFQNQSNNKQLPISIQLAIFLYCTGHYGNVCSPEDVGQWAGVSIGTVVNCTHHVIAALLDQHDKFVYIPGVHSEEMWHAWAFTESRTCCAWKNRVFAADSSMINLYARPGMFGDGFYDQKACFSLNCQVSTESR